MRQVLTTIIARHTDWEEEMLLRLGEGWRLDPAPAADEVITYSSKPAPESRERSNHGKSISGATAFNRAVAAMVTFAQSVLSDSIFGGAGDNLVLPVPDDLEMADPFSAELEAQGKVQVDLDAFAPVRVELSAGNVDETLRFSINQMDEHSEEVESESDSASDNARPFALNLEPETVSFSATSVLTNPSQPAASVQSEQAEKTEQHLADVPTEPTEQVSSFPHLSTPPLADEDVSEEPDSQVDVTDDESEESEFEDRSMGAALPICTWPTSLGAFKLF